MDASYAEVDRLRRDLVIAQASFSVGAISDEDYEIALARAKLEGKPFLTREQIHRDVVRAMNAVLIDQSRFPSDEDVKYARIILASTLTMRDRLLSLIPQDARESAAIVEDEVRTKMNAMTPIKDPAVVGWDTFTSGVAGQVKDIALFLPRQVAAGGSAIGNFFKGAYDSTFGSVFGTLKTGATAALIVGAIVGLVVLGLLIYIVVMLFRSGAVNAFAGKTVPVTVAAVA